MAKKITLQAVQSAQPVATTAVQAPAHDFSGIVKGLKAGEDGLLKAYQFAGLQGATHAATLGDDAKSDWLKALQTELVAQGCCGAKTAVTRASTCWKMVRLGRAGHAVNVLAALAPIPLLATGSETAATRYSRAATFVLKDADHAKAFFADPAKWYAADRAAAAEKDTSPQGVVAKAERMLETSLPKALAVALFGEKAKADRLPKHVRNAMAKAAADYVAAMRVVAPELEEADEDTVEDTVETAAPVVTPAATSPAIQPGGGVYGIQEWMQLGFTREEAIAEVRKTVSK